ncbi:shikimate dehydrogenase family protein [Flavisolibacter tropicus]|uniref:Shikimate dehydrogenase n=1 Tax=Flavisolibacter tropicus TaxID=1492898 RepID=A0A172TT95_9BACT|nr:shikimate dehydrogenase [Flavisolibacter tropicus]ANE50168.1 shikimate dehydrogenase [Flavisolibacter tropicus]
MRQFGLIGKTLTHSFSKTYFSKKFEQEGIADCSYQNFELPQIQDIDSLLSQYPDLKGFNITIPYKEEILPFLFQQNEIVQAVGACNCVKVIDGKFYGFNTDVIGFRDSLQPQLKPHHTKALILGWGGAAKAVAYTLTSLGIDYLVVSRKKAEKTITYSDIDKALLEQYTLIINTTPLGMYPNINDAPQIPYNLLSSKHFLFDLIYNPTQTKFLQLGAQQGSQTANGYDMLIGQAEESWRIWNTL